MATYLELRSLFNDADLRNKVEVAVTIAAEGIATNSTNETTERVAWSQDACGLTPGS
jgi:hypothetical protein